MRGQRKVESGHFNHKMANLAKIRQWLGKNLNDMAKGPMMSDN